jgi:hypothetical protein
VFNPTIPFPAREKSTYQNDAELPRAIFGLGTMIRRQEATPHELYTNADYKYLRTSEKTSHTVMWLLVQVAFKLIGPIIKRH